ncbi:hypothetical protein [Brevibacillus laterosporus]|nr:hypothetical protein [Brevibacillus laterosporus]
MSEVNFTAIGGNQSTKKIKASGQEDGTIAGAVNDGTKENSKANFAKFILQATPH